MNRKLSIAVCAALFALSACAPAGLQMMHVEQLTTADISPDATAEPEPTSTPTPHPSPATPTPSPSPTPQTIEAIDAGVVQSWLKGAAAPETKTVFLTFDDGPNDSVTPQVLDILRREAVPATFFVIGNRIDDAPQILKRAYDEGHAIGLHSWNHDYNTLYPGRWADPAAAAVQADKTLEKVRSVLGQEFSTSAWRYPGGHMSWNGLTAADQALADRGLAWVDWNAMTADAEPLSRQPVTVEAMVAIATEPIADGVPAVVVLAHDSPGKELTVQSLPGIISAYRDAGYVFGVIS